MSAHSQRPGVLFLIIPGTLALFTTATSGAAAVNQGAKPAPKKEAAGVDFPHMDPALSYLKEAQKQLEQAEPEFYGHRVKAMEHVKAAINDVQTGISNYLTAHPSEPRNVAPPEPVPNEAGDPFPHMHAALKLLENARTQLNEAARQYHGKRVEGLQQTNSAIMEINAGIAEYKAKHAGKK